MIRALEAQGKFSSLPPKVRAAAKARLENPDATLQELAEMLGISKSGMNHRMRKLKELAETSG
jgi:DNA-binding protein WhiA